MLHSSDAARPIIAALPEIPPLLRLTFINEGSQQHDGCIAHLSGSQKFPPDRTGASRSFLVQSCRKIFREARFS